VTRASGESGFTLIEVLVVMLILGLLAAIALPTFLNQRDKASDADAKVQVRTAQTAAETIVTDNGRYNGPNGVSVNNLRALEPVLNGADLTVQAATQNGYRIRVGSSTGNWFEVRRNNDSTFEYPCEDTGTGGCPSTGSWAN
jgi:type IV pilus assembly protein PilA